MPILAAKYTTVEYLLFALCVSHVSAKSARMNREIFVTLATHTNGQEEKYLALS